MEKGARMIAKDNKVSELIEGQEASLALQLEEMREENKILKAENERINNVLKDNRILIHIIAHDLKGPIGTNGVLADVLVSYLNDGSVTKEELKKGLEDISKNSEGAFNLLEELVTWVRLKEDGLKPEMLSLKLEDQVNESIEPLLVQAERKGVDFKNQTSSDVNILADSNMLKTVIRNLSSNAIKFTEENKGEIIISSEKVNNFIKIYIKDNGVGLSANQQNQLFNGTGITTTGTNGEKGTGFGLPMCKELIEKMNGTIEVESEGEGKGTKFIITLKSE